MQATTITVDFYGQRIIAIEHNDQPFVAMKPVAEGMGLDWKSQHVKLSSSARFSMVEITMQVPGDDQQRSFSCLPLRKLPGWLMTIHAGKVRPEIRDKVITYQNECDDVLWEHWTKRAANVRGLPTSEALHTEARKRALFAALEIERQLIEQFVVVGAEAKHKRWCVSWNFDDNRCNVREFMPDETVCSFRELAATMKPVVDFYRRREIAAYAR